LTPGNGAAAIGSDCSVVPAHDEHPASSKDVLKRISAVEANLQHATIKPDSRLYV
jgi:hypothetical protein